MKKLILASSSPRRKELLSHLKIPFEIQVADLSEESTYEKCEDIVQDIAAQKGRVIFDRLKKEAPNVFVISADTIVVLNNKIYGKPTDQNDSHRILTELSGQTHQVYTAVSFFFNDNQVKEHHISFYQKTDVTFAAIDNLIMKQYIQSGDGKDKAGAYGIQGMGLLFIKSIHGSYSNVVGFPIELIDKKLIETFKTYFGEVDYRKFFKAL